MINWTSLTDAERLDTVRKLSQDHWVSSADGRLVAFLTPSQAAKCRTLKGDKNVAFVVKHGVALFDKKRKKLSLNCDAA